MLLGRDDLGMMPSWKEVQKRGEEAEHNFSFLWKQFLRIKEEQALEICAKVLLACLFLSSKNGKF